MQQTNRYFQFSRWNFYLHLKTKFFCIFGLFWDSKGKGKEQQHGCISYNKNMSLWDQVTKHKNILFLDYDDPGGEIQTMWLFNKYYSFSNQIPGKHLLEENLSLIYSIIFFNKIQLFSLINWCLLLEYRTQSVIMWGRGWGEFYLLYQYET